MIFSLAMTVGFEICHFEVFNLEIHLFDDVSELLVVLDSTRYYIDEATSV